MLCEKMNNLNEVYEQSPDDKGQVSEPSQCKFGPEPTVHVHSLYFTLLVFFGMRGISGSLDRFDDSWPRH